MKTFSIILLAISSLVIFIGAFFKIMHWPYASPLLSGGLLFLLFGVGFFLFDFFQKKKRNEKKLDF